MNDAIRLKPDLAEAYNGRGYTYNELKQYQQAIKDFDEAIRLKPDLQSLYTPGNSLRNMTQYQQAIRDDDEAIRLKPDYAKAHSERGLAYILSGNKLEGSPFPHPCM